MVENTDTIAGYVENIDNVGTMAGYIEKYGPFIVILSIFLLLFILVVFYIVKQNQKVLEQSENEKKELMDKVIKSQEETEKKNQEMMDFIMQGQSELITLRENNKKKLYEETDIANTFTQLNKALKNPCRQILEKTKSDRTAIYVLHNGAQASHGLPFFKMTCICECISASSNSNIQMPDHAAVSLNFVDNIIDNLLENGQYRITEGSIKDAGDSIFIKDTKIKDGFFIPIYASDNRMSGFIFNGYNKLDSERSIETEKEYLEELANATSPVIEYFKFQEQLSNERRG